MKRGALRGAKGGGKWYEQRGERKYEKTCLQLTVSRQCNRGVNIWIDIKVELGRTVSNC